MRCWQSACLQHCQPRSSNDDDKQKITTMMMQLLMELKMVDGDNVFEGESASEGVNEED